MWNLRQIKGFFRPWGFTVARLFVVLLLFLAPFTHHTDRDFFTFLRLSVFAVSVYGVYRAFEINKKGWIWAFGFVAVLFNPLLKIHLDRSTWEPIDFITAIFFLASFFFLRERERLDREKKVIADNNKNGQEEKQNISEISNQKINENDVNRFSNLSQEIKQSTNKEIPKDQFPKYGRAWLLWMISFGSYSKYSKGNLFYSSTLDLIYVVLPLLLLIFYFWFRRLLIKRQKDYPSNNWKPPLYSLLVTYFILFVLTFPLFVIDGYIKGADFKPVFSNEFINEIMELNKKQEILMKDFDYSPILVSEIEVNVQKLDQYMEINNQKSNKFHQAINDLREMYSRTKKDKDKLLRVTKIESSYVHIEELVKQGVRLLKEFYSNRDANANKLDIAKTKFQEAEKSSEDFRKKYSTYI